MKLEIEGQKISIYHVDPAIFSKKSPVEIKKELFQKISTKKAILSADELICEEQVLLATERTLRLEKSDMMISNNWGIEVLLHLLGTHQIKIAIDFFNIIESTTSVLIIVVDEVKLPQDLIPGFPKFNLNDKNSKYNFPNGGSPCKEIISRGARLILDYY